MTDVFEQIERIDGVATRKDELLSLHTSLGVGGPCGIMVWVSNMEALREVLALSIKHTLPATVLGAGSNVLVRDGGISGIVIRLVDEFTKIEVSGERIRAGAGASLGDVVSKATSGGIGGLEFLAGIPGTIGGAAVVNAGSKDVWVSDRLVELKVLTGEISEVKLTSKDLSFGYRYSSIGRDWVVTEVTLAGHGCPVEDARRRVEEYLDMRGATQPAGQQTAGCIFKNPPDDAAGRLIEQAGLKGFRIGGAEVSTLHANWIVNTGGATAREILDLIAEIQTKVKSKYGTDLELEVSVIGQD